MKQNVFLGGTWNGSAWRDELIPLLEKEGIDYFNPIVEDWTEECIEIEEQEKWNSCTVHLYMITKEMKGVYSLIEFIDSILNEDDLITPMLVVNTEGMDTDMIKSLQASVKKINTWWYIEGVNKGRTCITITDNQTEAFDYILHRVSNE